jgi:hypothetical protein
VLLEGIDARTLTSLAKDRQVSRAEIALGE